MSVERSNTTKREKVEDSNPQANNASLQSNTKEYEDGDNNFIQAFMF